MKILLICTHNACRSIIGEAVINKIAVARITAKSAGSSPRGEIHPLTLKHLTRRDYDTSSLKSQSWNDFENGTPMWSLHYVIKPREKPARFILMIV